MKTISTKIKLAMASFMVVTLGGCATMDTITGKRADEIKEEFHEKAREGYQHLPRGGEYASIKFDSDFFKPPQSTNEEYPDWYYSHVDIAMTNTPFNVVMGILQNQAKMVTRFVSNVDSTKLVSITSKGRAGEALEKLGLASGYGYQIEGDLVTWSVYDTKTMRVSMPPSIQNFRIGEDGGQENNNAGGNGFGASVVQQEPDKPTSFSTLEVSELRAWESFKESVTILKSEKGKVSYDQASSILLVQDYPQNVKAIEDYVGRFNAASMTNVIFDIELLEYSDDNDNGASVNWNIVRNDLAIGSGNTRANAGLVSEFVSTVTGNSPPLTLGLGLLNGKFAGSQILIESLERQGVVTVQQRPRVYSSHNKVSRIRLGNEQAYAASSVSNQNQTSTASTLTAGLLSLGLEISILPTVMPETKEVYVQLGLTVNDLNGIQDFSSDTTRIQLPSTSKKDLTMSFSAVHGETILISGNRSNRSESNTAHSGLVSWLFGGSASASENNSELLILITPRIVNRWG